MYLLILLNKLLSWLITFFLTLCMQLFFVNENGKTTFTAKADIWSAFQTIIHVLLGRNVNDTPRQKVVY